MGDGAWVLLLVWVTFPGTPGAIAAPTTIPDMTEAQCRELGRDLHAEFGWRRDHPGRALLLHWRCVHVR
jgi:hypothetical protein